MRRTFSDAEYPEVTANIVVPSTMPKRTKGKQPIASSNEPNTEPEEVYWHIHTQIGVIASVDYSDLAWGIEVSETHFAIAKSQASNSSVEKEAFAYMTGTPEWPGALNSKPRSRESNSI